MFAFRGNISCLFFLHPRGKLSPRFDTGLSRSQTNSAGPSSNGWTTVIHRREAPLAKRVIEIFPEHTTYVEAFAGGAQVFFHKEPSKVEVLNDLDGEIVNFFRVCQQHYEELLRYFRFVVVSREVV